MFVNTYNIPRDVKGEGRILYIFSTKALIWTSIGLAIGFVIYLILNMLHLGFIGIVLMVLLGLVAFCIATFKVPETNVLEITKKTGGENIDEVIKRAIKFKNKKNKIYIYDTKEEGGNG